MSQKDSSENFLNPFIGSTKADTMQKVYCGLRYLHGKSYCKANDWTEDDDWCFGEALIYDTLMDALRVGKEAES